MQLKIQKIPTLSHGSERKILIIRMICSEIAEEASRSADKIREDLGLGDVRILKRNSKKLEKRL
jgi:hypothetical protein